MESLYYKTLHVTLNKFCLLESRKHRGKKENTVRQRFLLFLQCFRKASIFFSHNVFEACLFYASLNSGL